MRGYHNLDLSRDQLAVIETVDHDFHLCIEKSPCSFCAIYQK